MSGCENLIHFDGKGGLFAAAVGAAAGGRRKPGSRGVSPVDAPNLREVELKKVDVLSGCIASEATGEARDTPVFIT